MGAPGGEVVYLVGEVGFGFFPVYAGFGADVEVAIANPKPETTPVLEGCRLGDFGEAEEVAVKGARGGFCPGRDGDLGVVEGEDIHF